MKRTLAIAGTAFVIAVVIAAMFYGAVMKDAEPEPGDRNVGLEGTDLVLAESNDFGFELFKELDSEGDNVFFSPWSVSTALAMAYEGARGETAAEMAAVLRLPENDTERWEAFEEIFAELTECGEGANLSAANAFWNSNDFHMLENYTKVLDEYYMAEGRSLDFVGDPEGSRQTINAWVEGRTNGKIKDLIPQNAIGAMTMLILTNAIYMNARWSQFFDAANTHPGPFTSESGDVLTVPIMRNAAENATYNYSETEDFQAIELPYVGAELSMFVFLPKDGDILDTVGLLDNGGFGSIVDSMEERNVKVFIPQFECETEYDLVDALKGMGIKAAFGGSADFSGIAGTDGLYISKVYHKGFIKVYENGTEAAAATAVLIEKTGISPSTAIFNADHPFVFVIQHKPTGAILFMGKVANPLG